MLDTEEPRHRSDHTQSRSISRALAAVTDFLATKQNEKESIFSETCIIRPTFGLEKGSLYQQVVFISRFIQYVIRTICSEIGSLRIKVVFLDSGHIIQVSL